MPKNIRSGQYGDNENLDDKGLKSHASAGVKVKKNEVISMPTIPWWNYKHERDEQQPYDDWFRLALVHSGTMNSNFAMTFHNSFAREINKKTRIRASNPTLKLTS
jgi:hypothetical protein